jgi:hypothetical protein
LKSILSIALGYTMSYIIIYLGYSIILKTETWDMSILNESKKISYFFVFYLGIGFLIGRIVSKCGYLIQKRTSWWEIF